MTKSEAGKLGAIKTNAYAKLQAEERRTVYYKDPVICIKEDCTNPIPYLKRNKNKYCSHSCAASIANLGVRRHGRARTNEFCIQCEVKLEKSQQKFCTGSCRSAWKWDQRKNRIVEEQKVELGSEQVNRVTAKRYLLEVMGNVCDICNTSEWMCQPMPLILDHTDGNSSNNALANLRLVCGNCDMQLPTYKGRNFGNGRALRRKRYAEGKSY